MKKYSFLPKNWVDANEQRVLFYTYDSDDGIQSTTMWKYDINNKKVQISFVLKQRVNLRKYITADENNELQYIGVCLGMSSLVMGLDAHGNVLFEYIVGGFCSSPIYDMSGNLYLVVNDAWIHCLNSQGEFMWKWRPVSQDNRIKCSGINTYWIANGKLYVIAVGQEYVVDLEGNTEKIYALPEYSEATRYIVQNDKLFYTGNNHRELRCDNFRAEKLWKYCMQEDEIITQIIAWKENYIILKVEKRSNHSKALYVIDENGNVQWQIMRKCDDLLNISDDRTMLINDKKFTIYNADWQEIFQHEGKEYVLWSKMIAKRLLMIAERQGDVIVVERSGDLLEEVCVSKLTAMDDADEMLSLRQLVGWKKEIVEYLMLNMEIWLRYFDMTIQEVELSYELFEYLKIRVLTAENKWIDGMASGIPYEIRVDSDRDLFRECSCRDEIVWLEFCDECPKMQVRTVMEQVRETMSEQLKIPVHLKGV